MLLLEFFKKELSERKKVGRRWFPAMLGTTMHPQHEFNNNIC